MPAPDNPTHPPPRARLDAARRAFESAFARAPTHAASAPGRVNIIGDHVDYAGGVVLPMAIARSCIALAARNPSRRTLRVRSEGLDAQIELTSTDDLHPGDQVPCGSWASYPIGAAAELRAAFPSVDLAGLDILLTSDVPIGAGLSSSAAVTVATAMAIASLNRVAPAPLDIARICQRAEHRYANTPCGLMDQAAATLSRENHALLFDCHTETAQHIPVPPAAAFVVIDTRVHHNLASSAYADRRAASEAAARALALPSLRKATDAHRSAIDALPTAQRDAAHHIVSEIARVHDAAAALTDADLPRLGALMTESHASLRDLYRVSCPELDAVVDAALACPGVHGARMTGAGFGGSAIALLEAPATNSFEHNFRAALRDRSPINPALHAARPAPAAMAFAL